MDPLELVKQILMQRGSQTLTATQVQAAELEAQLAQRERMKSREQVVADEMERGRYAANERGPNAASLPELGNLAHKMYADRIAGTVGRLALPGERPRPSDFAGLSTNEAIGIMGLVTGQIAADQSAEAVQRAEAELLAAKQARAAKLPPGQIVHDGGGVMYENIRDAYPIENPGREGTTLPYTEDPLGAYVGRYGWQPEVFTGNTADEAAAAIADQLQKQRARYGDITAAPNIVPGVF